VVFTTNDIPLEKVPQFCYLGRMMANNNSDWPALYQNLRKAKTKWALISRPLIRTGVAPEFLGMFYKAIVQAVLLYGCETWVVTPDILRTMEGLHHWIARRITHKMPTQVAGQWVYPPIAGALSDAGLFTMEIHVRRRQMSIAEHIATRPSTTHAGQWILPPPTLNKSKVRNRSHSPGAHTYTAMTTPMPSLPPRPKKKTKPEPGHTPTPPASTPQPAPTPTTRVPMSQENALRTGHW
jgi:hypothetical protein